MTLQDTANALRDDLRLDNHVDPNDQDAKDAEVTRLDGLKDQVQSVVQRSFQAVQDAHAQFDLSENGQANFNTSARAMNKATETSALLDDINILRQNFDYRRRNLFGPSTSAARTERAERNRASDLENALKDGDGEYVIQSRAIMKLIHNMEQQKRLESAPPPPSPKPVEPTRHAKPCTDLKPDKLQKDDTPHMLDNWMEAFKAYHEMSNFKSLSPNLQLQYFKSCISESVLHMLRLKPKQVYYITDELCEENQVDTNESLFSKLREIWAQWHPTVKNRRALFNIRRDDNEDFDEYVDRFTKEAKRASLEGISEETLLGFFLLNGLNNTEWERRIVRNTEDKQGEITMKDIIQTVHYEQSIDTRVGDTAQAAPAHVNKVFNRLGPKVNKSRDSSVSSRHSDSKKRDWNAANFMELKGQDKFKAMKRERVCIRCATKHPGKCRYDDPKVICEICKKTKHIAKACCYDPDEENLRKEKSAKRSRNAGHDDSSDE